MRDGMQYDSIQGQGHGPLKVGNLAIFKGSLCGHPIARVNVKLDPRYAASRHTRSNQPHRPYTP